MFDILPNTAFIIVKPFMSAVLRKKSYTEDAIKRKYAIIPENGFSKDDNVIMIHGVSVGEINALETLIKKIRKSFPSAKLVVTTGTQTGQEIAHKKLNNIADLITYFPADFPVIVKAFLDKINPNVVLIAETEIWPTFAYECKKRGIKNFIINGRISDSTYKSYLNFRLLFKRFLNLYTGIYTQSDEDNQKFLSIGANPSTTKRMNNLKFDIKPPKVDFEFDKAGAKVLLAGSTHQGEDAIVLCVFRKLKEKHPNLKLIIAPRHLTRTEEVRALTESFGFKYAFRSENITSLKDVDVLILNTLGELGKMYAMSDISFIGGSFNKTGGHNPLESIVFNKPVISGPSIHNFKDIYSIIRNAGAGFVVNSQDEFFDIAEKLLDDCDFYNSTVKKGEKVFKEQQGALDFVIKLLKEYVQ